MNTMIFLSTQQVLIQLYNIYLLLLVTTLNVAFNYKEQLLNVQVPKKFTKPRKAPLSNNVLTPSAGTGSSTHTNNDDRFLLS